LSETIGTAQAAEELAYWNSAMIKDDALEALETNCPQSDEASKMTPIYQDNGPLGQLTEKGMHQLVKKGLCAAERLTKVGVEPSEVKWQVYASAFPRTVQSAQAFMTGVTGGFACNDSSGVIGGVKLEIETPNDPFINVWDNNPSMQPIVDTYLKSDKFRRREDEDTALEALTSYPIMIISQTRVNVYRRQNAP